MLPVPRRILLIIVLGDIRNNFNLGFKIIRVLDRDLYRNL
jgi:hypothetical protein